MTPSQHDLRVSAALVPLTADLQILTTELTILSSNLGLGMATSEERSAADYRCAVMAEQLQALRRQIIPSVPGQVLDEGLGL